MGNTVKFAFETGTLTIPLDRILPARKIDERTKKCQKFASIVSSIQEIGLVEAPVVHPLKDSKPQKYLMLDGHLRLEALKQLGFTEVTCLISNVDDTYTYNVRVNHLVPIQEHFMILKALKMGVSEERIARTLHVDVTSIRSKRNLLNGICPDAVSLLKDKNIGAQALTLLRRVKPQRQIEIAEMLVAVANYSSSYIKALVAATPKNQLSELGKSKNTARPEDIARIEREMETLERDFKAIEEKYGENVLSLVLVRGYVSKLLENAKVVRFFSNNHPDILAEFQRIIESASLES